MTSTPSGFDVARMSAIDVHVHLEHTGSHVEADEAAAKYFGASGDRDWNALADYYRSRQMGCVVFTVDEKLSGRPQVPNDAVVAFAAQNADIAMAFVSLAAGSVSPASTISLSVLT